MAYWGLVVYLNLGPARDHCWMVFQFASPVILDPESCLALLLTWLSFDLPLDYLCLFMSVAYMCYQPWPGLLNKILPIDSVLLCLHVANL